MCNEKQNLPFLKATAPVNITYFRSWWKQAISIWRILSQDYPCDTAKQFNSQWGSIKSKLLNEIELPYRHGLFRSAIPLHCTFMNHFHKWAPSLAVIPLCLSTYGSQLPLAQLLKLHGLAFNLYLQLEIRPFSAMMFVFHLGPQAEIYPQVSQTFPQATTLTVEPKSNLIKSMPVTCIKFRVRWAFLSL